MSAEDVSCDGGNSVDQYRCHDCGWQEEGIYAEEDHDRCPECNAPFNNYYVQKVFASNNSNTDLSEQDLEDAELVEVSPGGEEP